MASLCKRLGTLWSENDIALMEGGGVHGKIERMRTSLVMGSFTKILMSISRYS